MNRKLVLQIIGKMLFAEALLMILPLLVSMIYGEWDSVLIFSLISVGLALIGMPALFVKVKDRTMYAKEGLVIVIMTWMLWSIGGAMPFYLGGWIPKFADAFFETVSGFTTTGATILSKIEGLPYGVLFWRSFTHWIGGMGVLFFVMAVVPISENHSIHIMRAELTGPNVDKIVPKGMNTAKILYGIYLSMTLLEAVLLYAGGMSVYDSITHAFSTAGTGGFSSKNASIAHYDSAYIDWVITIFMLLFSINFNMFYFLLIRKFAAVRQNSEWKVFLGIVAASTLVVAVFIYPEYRSVFQSLRYSAFQVASCISTTGFVTADFDQWHEVAKYVLFLVMIIGACAGSTGGGLKIIRLQVLWQSAMNELKKMLHPQTISRLKLDGKGLSGEMVNSTLVYFVLLLGIFTVSVFLVGLNGRGVDTTVSAVISCMNNVGPGLDEVGPVMNYGGLSAFSKYVLCADMLLGRLEIYPVLLLFAPKLWKKKFI